MLNLMTKGIQLIKNHNPLPLMIFIHTGREVFVQALVMPGYE